MTGRYLSHLFTFTRRDYGPSIRGLGNCGLSCCVNALLQSVSATEELLKLLERWEPSGNEERNNVPLLLRKTLHAMKGESPQPAPHSEFLDCLHRNSIHRNVQHDADEVFLSILNLIQQQMTDAQLKEEILELYKVKVEGHVKCAECTYDHEVNSYMLSFPLPLQEGPNDMVDCIKTFFKKQDLRGEDKCYCDRCGEKQPSTLEFKLCSLPKILCIHLKRFRNEDGRTKKLDCKVTFPKTLNFSSILNPENISEVFKKDDSPYSLYAVVVHSGYAMFGHYTAYIQPPGAQTWYYADDSHVQQVNWEKVQSCFGGRMGGDTAYMLLYRRQTTSGDQGCSG